MKKINNKIILLVLIIILTLVSILYIIIRGKTYTISIDIQKNFRDTNNIGFEIEQDKEIIECIDEKIEGGFYKIKLKSINKGKVYIRIGKNDDAKLYSVYVHDFGIITFDEFLGKCTGEKIVPISILVILTYLLYILIKDYKKNINNNLYQYKNITYLGLIIFTGFSVVSQVITIINYSGFINSITQVINVSASFSLVLLPIAFITSILVTISNIMLVKNEGLNLKNLLGILLGGFLCFLTIAPNLLNNILQSATWIDVHNQQGFAVYLQNFIEATICITVTYLESILIATIILARKAAKHIPEFNKDYILILGCQINKDGTLTNLLKGRVDRALEFRNMQKEKTGKDLIFIPSGGKGDDEIISEAEAMRNYLLEHGIKEKEILIEDKSKNTYENIKFSNKIIKEKLNDAKIALSTTNYHVFRAGAIADSQGLKIEGIGAKTKTYFWINAFIREFIATLNAEKKKHISAVLAILVLIIIMIYITYLSN